MTIMLELSKFFSKDLNVVVAYDLFKKINEKRKINNLPFTNNQMRNMFIVALQNLKYMGYFSASRASAFSLKKNYFGKPELAQDLLSLQNKSSN